MKDEGSVDYKHDSPQFFVQCRESEPGAFKVSGRYQAIAHLRPGTLEDLMGIFNIFYTEGDGVSVPMETYIEDSETQKPEFTHKAEPVFGRDMTRKFVPARLTFLEL